jgi:hypothetical protein
MLRWDGTSFLRRTDAGEFPFSFDFFTNRSTLTRFHVPLESERCYSADYAWQSPWYGCSSKYSTALYKHAPGTGIPSPAPSSTSLELPSASSTPSATTPASPVSTGCSAEVLLNKSCPPSSLNGAGGWTPFGCFAAYSAAVSCLLLSG